MIRRLRNSLRAGKLLLRTLVSEPRGGKIIADQKTLQGTAYDVYEPSGPTLGTHIMVYGLDYAGEKDPRLVRFARAYVDSGLRVAIPKLPGLKSFAFEIGDMERVGDLISTLHRQYGSPIRITTFSAGAGIALAALSEYALDEEVDLLLMFTPYYSLPELWASLSSTKSSAPINEREWDHFLFGQMALAYRIIESLGLTAAEREEFLNLLEKYCVTSLSEKVEFYDRVLSGKEIPEFGDLSPDEETLEQLSPAGKLSSVSTRVLIIHDPEDLVLPPEHSRHIILELSQRRVSRGERLLVTPLISHVSPRVTLRVFDLLVILDMMGELYN